MVQKALQGYEKKYGYKQGDLDHTMFFKRSKNKIAILIIYVDDMFYNK
jgi:hypothetical protein